MKDLRLKIGTLCQGKYLFNTDEVLQILDAYRQNVCGTGDISTRHLKEWWEKRKPRNDDELETNTRP